MKIRSVEQNYRHCRVYANLLNLYISNLFSDRINNEEYDPRVPDDVPPDEEVPLKEELQIILPPRCDDVAADSSNTTTSTDS